VALRKAKMARRLADELRAGIVTRLTGEPPVYSLPPTDVILGTTIERHIERRGSQQAQEDVELVGRAGPSGLRISPTA
jgi:hypothetical protein